MVKKMRMTSISLKLKVMKNKRGQITIFVILALIIIVGIIFIFVLRKGPEIGIVSEENPQAYIESCTKDFVEEAIDILSEQGGDIESKGNTMFRGKNLTYLCYNANFYTPCTMQRPMLIEHIENEITQYIKPRISNCFQVLKTTLEPRYDVEMNENWDLITRLTSKGVEININRDFKMQRGDDVRTFNLFKTNLVHPIYDLAEIAIDIANQEAEYCNFDILSYMIMFPEFRIDKYRPGNGDVVYRIGHLRTNQDFTFAVRSCALPPGF
jgi:hypothetical protein